MASPKVPRRPSLTRRILRDPRRPPVPVWDLPGRQTIGHLPDVVAARFQPILLAATKAGQDPQVDALWCARADAGDLGRVSHIVRLDLAPLEVVTAG